MKVRASILMALLAAASAVLIFHAANRVVHSSKDVFPSPDGVVATLSAEDSTGRPLTSDLFFEIAKRMNPTVVNVYTTQAVSNRSFGELLDDPFFRRFFGGELPDQQQRQNALGSGVIIDRTGYILTNNHVVEKAEEIRVSREDTGFGRNGMKAKVVGRDSQTDLALIKVDAGKDLPAAPLGDSNHVRVGDWVVAIGNPFNLGHTVTVGVVSAKARELGGSYDDFIQTDASINPGNSGGPLLNLRGEVIGINTSIFSTTGQWAGIGFAVPVHIAKQVVPELKERGRVVRGQIGVTIQTQWSDALAAEFGVDHGALVSNVQKGSPAEKAGLQRGDVIVAFNGKPIQSGRDLSSIVAATDPGSNVEVKIIRDKKEKSLNITVNEMKEQQRAAAQEENQQNQDTTLGLTVAPLDADTAREMNLETDRGVVILDVKIGSPAERAGLERGDVILEVNREQVRSVHDLQDAVSKAQAGRALLLLISRRGDTFFVPVTPEKTQ